MNPAPFETSDSDATVLRRLLSERHSCRAYLPTSVKRETIGQILEMAQRTASWCNAQPWNVIVTTNAGTERFRAAYCQYAVANTAEPDFDFPREYHGAYLERRRECGFQLYESVGVVRGDREASARQAMENFRFFGAPHVAIITTEASLGVYGALDCGAYIANFMLAAHSLGVASVAQASLAAHPQFVREYFGLPENRLVVCGISFGIADQDHAVNQFRTRRADCVTAVTWIEY